MGNKQKPDAKKIVKLLKKSVKPSDIANILDVPVRRVYNVRSRAKITGELTQVSDISNSLVNYEPELIDNIKHTTLSISTILTKKNFNKESSTQLAKTMGILIDKLRLIEGKSTQNISAQIVGSLEPEQLKILEEMGRSLIKSMLPDQ